MIEKVLPVMSNLNDPAMPFSILLEASLRTPKGTTDPNLVELPNSDSIYLAERLLLTSATINNWRGGRNFPLPVNLRDLLELLFGIDFHNVLEARNLVDA